MMVIGSLTRKRIKHELTKNLHPYRFCPALNPSLIQEVIDALPNVVNPKKIRIGSSLKLIVQKIIL